MDILKDVPENLRQFIESDYEIYEKYANFVFDSMKKINKITEINKDDIFIPKTLFIELYHDFVLFPDTCNEYSAIVFDDYTDNEFYYPDPISYDRLMELCIQRKFNHHVAQSYYTNVNSDKTPILRMIESEIHDTDNEEFEITGNKFKTLTVPHYTHNLSFYKLNSDYIRVSCGEKPLEDSNLGYFKKLNNTTVHISRLHSNNNDYCRYSSLENSDNKIKHIHKQAKSLDIGYKKKTSISNINKRISVSTTIGNKILDNLTVEELIEWMIDNDSIINFEDFENGYFSLLNLDTK